MSADAVAWPKDDTEGSVWQGRHDLSRDLYEAVGLSELLRVLEAGVNDGKVVRWVPSEFADGRLGLKGYCV